MAHKTSAPSAASKRKASASDKHNGDNRAKKARTAAGRKHQKLNDDESITSDGDDSGFSDSADGGAGLKHAKPARAPGKPKEQNFNASGRTAERGSFPLYGSEFLSLTFFQPRAPERPTPSRKS